MEEVLNFINRHENENQRQLMMYLHQIIINYPNITAKISYKIPFYRYKRQLCYLNPVKFDAVELAFVYGNELSNEQGLLKFNNRKQIAGITFQNIDSVPLQLLDEILQEAILLDDLKSAKK